MLGHKVFQVLSRIYPETLCTIRGSRTDPAFDAIGITDNRVVEHVDATELGALDRLLTELRPTVIVNCIGVVKQRLGAEAIPSITINSLLPHRLAAAAARWGGRVIHFSTDCVFNGSKGNYREEDASDAEDLYGRSKYLGEVASENALTLRTSIIGRELKHHASLLEWFLRQEGGRVRGFTQAWWSGVTTNHLAELVARIIQEYPALSGLYQVSSGKISKYELLLRLRDAFELNIEIEPSSEPFCDRSLQGDRLRRAMGYRCPEWDVLIGELVRDPTSYTKWTDDGS
jgi:dTDP-4-dehydrorhamnose reductase